MAMLFKTKKVDIICKIYFKVILIPSTAKFEQQTFEVVWLSDINIFFLMNFNIKVLDLQKKAQVLANQIYFKIKSRKANISERMR